MLLFSSCVNGEVDIIDAIEKTTYEIKELNYLECDDALGKDINIVYPQIDGLLDENIERIICNELKEAIFNVLENYSELNDMDIDVTYSVTFASDKILSVHFISSAFHSAQAYPLVHSSSVNLTMETGEKFEIDDMLIMDEEFIKSFYDIFYLTRDYGSEEARDLILNDIKGTLNIEDVASMENNTGIHVFLTEDAMVISVRVRYAAGSYALFEAKYSDLEEYLKMF